MGAGLRAWKARLLSVARSVVTNAICRITVLPDRREAIVEQGTLLQEAIAATGVAVSLPCGGQGRCGRCLVRVEDGPVRRRASARLTPAQVQEGYALACQTTIEGNVTVYVPPQQAEHVPSDGATGAADKAASLAVACEHRAEPWIKKYALTIEPPSLDDNTNDFDRLRRELARQHQVADCVTTLPVLQTLAGKLRAANWQVTAVLEHGNWQAPDSAPRLVDVCPGDTTGRTLALAIDIGTTTNVVYLVDLASGALLDQASAYNGQIACGEDVISRIIYARRPGGLERLQALVMQTLNGLIDDLLARHGLTPEEIYLAAVAGNTTMIHLFLGLDPQHIRLEPYIPTVNHPMPVTAAALGLHIHPQATVDCLPGVGSYVGGDITAGVVCSRMAEEEPVTLFIDVGTNGEIVLGNSEWLLSCACSAGPAFEGAGVACGMRATEGAIERVRIDRRTFEPTYESIGGAAPRGICGSGMISLLGEMFVTGVIDKSGHLNRHLDTPRIREGADGPEYVIAWASEAGNGNGNGNGSERAADIVITEPDIQNLLRAKAAIYAGISVLVHSMGLEIADVERFIIGGAFGKYIDIDKAVEIGLLPDVERERFTYLGNTSVQGAAIALLCREHRAHMAEIAKMMTYLELGADNSFMNEFTLALFLPHTDLDSFHSVKRELVANGRG
jgi:uncharacterized 2Fe-2S/4Fe-4S cluster protein (DUF4445 family)